MARFQVADAKVELGQCFVQFGAAISPDTDLAGLLTRHARQDYAPGMLIEEWGGRIASSWDGGAVIIIVETVTMSAEGWRGPLTFVETISRDHYQQHVAALERGEFAPLNHATTRVGQGYRFG